MKAASNNNQIQQSDIEVQKITLKEQGNITPESLHKIITKKNGAPDLLAIAIYVEARSWFKPKKTESKGNVIYSSKLKGYGFHTGYEHFAKKYGCSKDLIRTKFVLLEKLGLLKRDFKTEYFYGKRFNNLMYLLVWKNTPHFYSEIGLENPNKVSTNSPENQGHLSENSMTPILENKDNIYVIPNNYPIEEQESLKSSLSSSFKDIPVIEGNKTHAREETEEIKKKKDFFYNKESKSPPCANGSLNEPSQVDFSHNETRASKETELAEQTKPTLSTTPKEATTIQLTPNYQEPNQQQYPRLLTAKEEKTIHQGRMARTDENTGVSCFAELMSKVLSNSEQQTTQEEIPVMKQEEPSLIPDKETNKMLLSKAIFNSFGERSANEIQDNCEFEELAFDKVAIKPASGVSFNDIEKAKIRKCIQSVYGEDVKLVAIQTQLVELTQIRPETKAETKADESVNQSMPAKSETVNERITQNQQWLRLRTELTKALLKKHREEKYAQHIVKNWFDKLQVSTESSRDKLILISSSFVIGWINDNYLHPLEQAVLASNFIVELRDDGNQERPIILTKEMINRGK